MIYMYSGDKDNTRDITHVKGDKDNKKILNKQHFKHFMRPKHFSVFTLTKNADESQILQKMICHFIREGNITRNMSHFNVDAEIKPEYTFYKGDTDNTVESTFLSRKVFQILQMK